jgi:hypothetical protein
MTMRVEHAEKIAPAGIAWRAVVVGIGYLVLLTLGGAMLVSLGADLPQIDNGSGLLPWTLISGVAIGLVLGSFASHISATHIRHIFVWVSLLFLNGVAVIIEGHFFVPDLISLETIPFLVIQQLIVAVGTATLITFLFAPNAGTNVTIRDLKRSWFAWLWRVGACAFTYVGLFLVVGGLNYALFTRPFYEQQAGLAIPEMPILLAVETMRGILIVTSILPFILTLRTSKRRLMISAGLALFVVGGVVPLMLQVPTLPGFLLLASGWEIFFQLFPTGVATAALLAL